MVSGETFSTSGSYRNFTYLGGRTLQEAATRYLLKDTTAARATRAVVSDYRRSLIPLDDGYGIRLRGQYVWDFGTGKELASWYPESETYANVFTPTKRITEQFRFAISPDGEFIAEGGNGLIRLYKIVQSNCTRRGALQMPGWLGAS